MRESFRDLNFEPHPKNGGMKLHAKGGGDGGGGGGGGRDGGGEERSKSVCRKLYFWCVQQKI